MVSYLNVDKLSMTGTSRNWHFKDTSKEYMSDFRLCDAQLT